jgi:hypothetical protein
LIYFIVPTDINDRGVILEGNGSMLVPVLPPPP